MKNGKNYNWAASLAARQWSVKPSEVGSTPTPPAKHKQQKLEKVRKSCYNIYVRNEREV